MIARTTGRWTQRAAAHWISTSIGLLLFSVQSAASAWFVADPDSQYVEAQAVPVGTAFNGVTLSVDGSGADVLALGAGLPNGPPGVFPSVVGHTLVNFPTGGCSGCWSVGYSVLRADFTIPARNVEVDFISRFAGAAQLFAFGQSGDLIDISTAPLADNAPEATTRVTLAIDGQGQPIAYVLAAADSGTFGVIDQMRWTVSEPATATLMFAALAALLRCGRRTHRPRA